MGRGDPTRGETTFRTNRLDGWRAISRNSSRFWTVVGLALASAIALTDVALGDALTVIGLLSTAPLLTSMRATPRATALVGAYAVLLALLVGVPDGIFGTIDHLTRSLVVVLVALIAVRVALWHERSERAEGEARLVVDQVQDYAIFVLDTEGRIVHWNAGAARIYGYERHEVTGRVFSLLHSRESRQVGEWERMLAIARDEGTYESEAWRVRQDGTRFMAHISVTPLRDRDGNLRGYSNITRDISDQWAADQEQERNDRRATFLAQANVLLETSIDYEATLDHVAHMAVPGLADWAFVELLQDDGSIKRLAMAHADPSKEALIREYDRRYPLDPEAPEGSAKVIRTGKPELIEEIPDELLELVAQDPEHLRILRDLGFRSTMMVPLRARGRTLGGLSLASAESGRLYNEGDLAMVQDLATRCALAIDNARLYAEAQARENEMRHQALHDPLTGLPNRTLFLDRLGVALARSSRREGEPALLFFDLDGFKAVNDTRGHEVGDQLLRALPERLEGALRAEDTVARFGGDEFTVLCEDVAAESDAIAIAGRLVAALEEPFDLPGDRVRVGASLGIAFAHDPDDTPEGLLRDADAAMYEAKRRGGRRFHVFERAPLAAPVQIRPAG